MTKALEQLLFTHRRAVCLVFAFATVVFAVFCARLNIDAGFEKLLPRQHPFMDTYRDHRELFGGANRLLVAVRAKDGDIFQGRPLLAAKRVSDRLAEIDGIAETSLTSIFTSNAKYYEIVEGGSITGGNIVHNGAFLYHSAFTNALTQGLELSPEQRGQIAADIETIRGNVIKSRYLGHLVANDFSAVLVRANLLEVNRDGTPTDYFEVAEQLESRISAPFLAENLDIDIHIIGFAKSIGDIASGAAGVVLFFGIAIAVTILLVHLFTHSWRLTVLPVICSLIAVCWNLGLLPMIGFGLDPMSLLVPFLVFAIGVSHGVQMINSYAAAVAEGLDPVAAARANWRRLVVPCAIALISDTIGFITIWVIDIRIIRELAVTASLGVLVIILVNLLLLPVLLSYVKLGDRYLERRRRGTELRARVWRGFAACATSKVAAVVAVSALLLAVLGALQGRRLQVGDLKPGVPELRQTSRYNQDTALIVDRFDIGVDVLNIIVETEKDGCTNPEIMASIDHFQWELANLPGVQSTLSVPQMARIAHGGLHSGGLKWRTVARDVNLLADSVNSIPPAGLSNGPECSVMSIMVFLGDHKAATLELVTDAAASLAATMNREQPRIQFRLATGNAGVMAATNEVVKGAQLKIMLCIYAAIVLLCLLTFRSLRATLCIVLPLCLVSILCYALMALLGIGLKIYTLPVAALGAGIGVDYGIYIYSSLRHRLREHGGDLRAAYRETLEVTGNAVLVTGLTLAVGVSTWIFSALKFQADMGVLLTFMFLGNMLGALVLLPALARLIGISAAPSERSSDAP